MLVADAGAKLRDAATGDGVLDAWCDVLPRYARLQERAAPMVDRIEALDTPDHRLATLRAWLGSVIDDAQVIRLDEGEGLTSAERSRLRKALPRVGALCDELAGLGVPETVQHDDLHDGNVLVRDGRAVIFDWGDACIAHPLLTLAITLPFAAWRASLPEDAPQVDRIRDAYLEHWTTRASPDRLRRAVPAAITVGWISRALTWHAVVTHFEAELEEAERYPVARSLRRVLELLG